MKNGLPFLVVCVLICGCQKQIADDPWFLGRSDKLFSEVAWTQVPAKDLIEVPEKCRERAVALLSARAAVLATTEIFGADCVNLISTGDGPRQLYLVRILSIPHSGLWVYTSPDGMVATHATALGETRPATHGGILVDLPAAPKQVFVEANFAR